MSKIQIGFGPEQVPSNKVQQRILDQFIENGNSSHSSQAALLWIPVRYCEENKLRYRIEAWPGVGYCVSLVKE